MRELSAWDGYGGERLPDAAQAPETGRLCDSPAPPDALARAELRIKQLTARIDLQLKDLAALLEADIRLRPAAGCGGRAVPAVLI
jgi:hypothetical protein